jgi:hypothetical protein
MDEYFRLFSLNKHDSGVFWNDGETLKVKNRVLMEVSLIVLFRDTYGIPESLYPDPTKKDVIITLNKVTCNR